MIETSAPTERITCAVPGPRNDYGNPKLIATIDAAGLWVWCRYCREPHLISRERCMAAWERGESVQCVASGEQGV